MKEAIGALKTPEVIKVARNFPGAYFKFKDILLKRLEDVINYVTGPIIHAGIKHKFFVFNFCCEQYKELKIVCPHLNDKKL